MNTQPVPTFPLVRNMEQFEGMSLDEVAGNIKRSYPFGTDAIYSREVIQFFINDIVYSQTNEVEKEFLLSLADKNDEVSDTIIREALLKLAYDS